MQKWEYLFEQTETAKEIASILSKAGEEGWELVAVTTLQGTEKKEYGGKLGFYDSPWFQWNLFFKRPKP
jgi:hypothetical protein